MDKVLTEHQRNALRTALAGRLVVLCFGAGVDSTGLMVALRAAGLRPDLVSMGDVGDEKPGTWQHVERMGEILYAWGWPPVTVCRKVPLAATGYTSLSGNCWKNETLPSLAFGLKSCSHKWKTVPQDQLLMGVGRGPNKRPPHPLWLQAQAQGRRIVKLIGYDCADLRRSHKVPTSDRNFDYLHPLQLIGWHRQDCVCAIVQALGPASTPSCWSKPCSWSAGRSRASTAGSTRWNSARHGKSSCATPTRFPAPARRSGWAGPSRGINGPGSTR